MLVFPCKLSIMSLVELLLMFTAGPGAAEETVKVAAGTFTTTKVEIFQSWGIAGPTASRVLTVWYAPEIKRAVKFLSRGRGSNNIETDFELELVSRNFN